MSRTKEHYHDQICQNQYPQTKTVTRKTEDMMRIFGDYLMIAGAESAKKMFAKYGVKNFHKLFIEVDELDDDMKDLMLEEMTDLIDLRD